MPHTCVCIHVCTYIHTHGHTHTCAHMLTVDYRSLQDQCLGSLALSLKTPSDWAALIKTECKNSKKGRGAAQGKNSSEKIPHISDSWLLFLDQTKRYLQKTQNERLLLFSKTHYRFGDRWTCILPSFFPKWFILGSWTPALQQGFLLSLSSGHARHVWNHEVGLIPGKGWQGGGESYLI